MTTTGKMPSCKLHQQMFMFKRVMKNRVSLHGLIASPGPLKTAYDLEEARELHTEKPDHTDNMC